MNMDSETLKILLDSQNQAFRSALDVVKDQCNARVTQLENTISELTRSLEFSQAEIQDLKSEMSTLRKSDNEKQAIISECKTRIEELTGRVNYQEDHSRRNNLRISGIAEQNGETWEQTALQVLNMVQEKLQLPPVKLERAHRVGPHDNTTPRTIVARFEHYGEREAVLRNARKLKGTGIYINEDLCPASQEIIRGKLPLLKQARSEGKIAYFKYTRLIIRDRTNPRSLQTADGAAGGDDPASDAPSSVPAVGGRASQTDGDEVVVGSAAAPAGRATLDRGAMSGGAAPDDVTGAASLIMDSEGDGTSSANEKNVSNQQRQSRRDRKKK